MEKRFETFTTQIAQLNRSVQRIKSAEMARFGLKGVHATCMMFLRSRDGMTQAELTRECMEDKATISRAVSALTRCGLVKDNGLSGERRYRAPLQLTEKGAAIADRVSGLVDEAVNAGGEGISEEDREILYACLQHINRNLAAYADTVTADPARLPGE